MELTNEEKNIVINILTQVRVPVSEAITIIKIIGKIKGSEDKKTALPSSLT